MHFATPRKGKETLEKFHAKPAILGHLPSKDAMKSTNGTGAKSPEVGTATAVVAPFIVSFKSGDDGKTFTANVDVHALLALLAKSDPNVKAFAVDLMWTALVHRKGKCQLPTTLLTAETLFEAMVELEAKQRAGKPTKIDVQKGTAAWEVLSAMPPEKQAAWSAWAKQPATLEGCIAAEQAERIAIATAAKQAAEALRLKREAEMEAAFKKNLA